MNSQALDEFEGLVAKFTELLIGDSSPENIEKIKVWALYSHIHKTMPALTGHWNGLHPEMKAGVRELYEEVRSLNQKLKAENQKLEQQAQPDPANGQES
ncbi:YusU family protein [Paenibacillus mucilaginosus]|uniref:YusU n=3 Tax=Paenibacillus mucilaginosus TaxID=61624 RepID=H6NBE1_9BACL|nr:YusU family protein [Paenibacillus mucilaginosus]AEI45142.1 hypothetical protein KNP414_06621 [Paenibacillus mucilaginosus KNP414]AFC32887.1 hypothetical protein PM3016_6251 [Paenibacillus mucilaginosus 3016]AFH65198.1 hypothetical protein B2K_31570 [Paenibacillus mucilaginosus K02]MCG7212965.1 YusU family protein [Paenibacillus mucilaginosus]WDM26622.1 YusU family protein [Paenibacillus mucilaginosus]